MSFYSEEASVNSITHCAENESDEHSFQRKAHMTIEKARREDVVTMLVRDAIRRSTAVPDLFFSQYAHSRNGPGGSIQILQTQTPKYD